jgi:hypothetical protein
MLMKISLFGWLDRIPFWRDLSYVKKGTFLRALKAGASVAVGILVAAATGGLLFPATWNPLTILIVTSFLQAADKFLREKDAADELKDTPLTDTVPNEATDVTNLNPPADEPIDPQI